MAGNTTVDTKPGALHLNEVRPRGRSASSHLPMHDNGATTPFPGALPYGYLNPFMMPMPPIYYQGQGSSSGNYLFPPLPVAPANHTQAGGSDVTPIAYPDMVSWFRSLDEHEGRNKDGINFSPFGAVLKAKGFLRITQLTRDLVGLKDLQEWLGIEVGTAVLILQYAKEDIDAVKAGKWLPPKGLEM
jgi:hypothetical protein